MNTAECDRIAIEVLTDYTAGELSDSDAAALEQHLFACAACAARAASFEALVRAIGPAIRSGEFGGFVTDAVLNQLARDGVRVRTFVLTPGAAVACAVWDDDEVLALRLRADLHSVSEVTLSQRVAGTEVVRAGGQVATASPNEVIYITPAAWVRELPVVEVDVVLTAHDEGADRTIGSYTLLHGGSLHR